MVDKVQPGLDGIVRRYAERYDKTFAEVVEARVPRAHRDVTGRAKVSLHQNIYDADFEYSAQSLRWESLTSGVGSSIAHVPGEGGVRMTIGTVSGAVTIRQSRPYHRYQPGKTMFMATAVNFGSNNQNQVQRVGYFDDNNGAFFEQSANPQDPFNPAGMNVVLRSDVQSLLTQGRPTDIRIPAYMWSDPTGILPLLDWTRLQMLWLEYAWYGGGGIRWGVMINGEPIILHEISGGNNEPDATQSSVAPLGGPSTATSTTSFTVANANWIPNQWASRTLQITPSTTVAAASNGATLPQGTINVGSTTGFAASGQVYVGSNLVNYTGVTATTLTGCTGGILTMFTGQGVQAVVPTLARITANGINSLTIADSVTGSALSVAPTVGHNWAILVIPAPGRPWARTGNLPVRYEQRNVGVALANTMVHYGVSVLVEGRSDDQRGFTYAYGMDRLTPRRSVPSNSNRYPVLTIRPRAMGTIEYTQVTAACTGGTTSALNATTAAWTTNQWAGRHVQYFTSSNTVSNIGRIVSNTNNQLNIVDTVTGLAVTNAPVAGGNYTIGLIDRGQLLPRQLIVSCDAVAIIELVAGTPSLPVTLTGASFVAAASLGMGGSFAERDVSATALSGGEVVMAFTSIAGSGVQQLDLENLFPLYTSIRGDVPDTLTLTVSTPSSGGPWNVGAHIICQEAMS
jgi:hypothetical protein